MANFVPALERRKSVNKRKRETYLQSNCAITAFQYHQGFSFTFEHLEHSKTLDAFTLTQLSCF